MSILDRRNIDSYIRGNQAPAKTYLESDPEEKRDKVEPILAGSGAANHRSYVFIDSEEQDAPDPDLHPVSHLSLKIFVNTNDVLNRKTKRSNDVALTSQWSGSMISLF